MCPKDNIKRLNRASPLYVSVPSKAARNIICCSIIAETLRMFLLTVYGSAQVSGT